METDFRHIPFKAIDLTVSSINDRRYDNEDFNLHLQVEQLLLKCAIKSNYEKEFHMLSELYGNYLHPNDLKYQLQAFGTNFKMAKCRTQ